MAFNRRVFPLAADAGRREPVVLFELNQTRSAHIAYAYLANVLAESQQARIVAYPPIPMRGWLQKLYFRVKRTIGFDEFGVYRSFGTAAFLDVTMSAGQKARARVMFEKILPSLKGTRDIEALKIDGVWVGDLIYDSYLMTFLKPTIDKDAPDFRSFLLESIELFVFWDDYLNANDVRAVNVSHCVYSLAIPLRLAVRRNIPAFQANATHLYRLSSGNLFAYNDFIYFRQRFAALPHDVQESGIAEAQKRIERRFAGEVGVDMPYSTKSAYGASRHQRLLRESPRKKILIATHCFFDSPHSYGNNIFPDFYEWLDFLGKMTETTNYDWYIKTHPDYLPGTKEIIDGFVARYPKFTLLPADASHNQIIAEGIDLALTVYGTIAFEYAALGVPVIIASQTNPHIAYDFNLHAKDVEDYRRMLLGLGSLDFNIEKRQVYEYYFMRYIYNTENLFFEDYDATIESLGGYYAQFTPAVYDSWLAESSTQKNRAITTALHKFLESGDFRMDYTHYGREFAIKPEGNRT